MTDIRRAILLLLLMVVAVVANAAVTIQFNCTKNSWSTIGNENGEEIGTVTVTGIQGFDHVQAEIRCAEDADQYISLANVNSNGGKLYCYTWEGGHHDLNKGYHYTLTINAFDVPWYDAKPVATTTYTFEGTGVSATTYCDVTLTDVSLKPNDIILNGYDVFGTTFDVTFSQSVSRVETWWAKGFLGSEKFTATKKSSDGRTWTVHMSDQVLTYEGSVCVMVTAWNQQGVQMRGENGDHAYAINIIISNSSPDTAIGSITTHNAHQKAFNISGQRVTPNQQRNGIVIIDGKKIIIKR